MARGKGKPTKKSTEKTAEPAPPVALSHAERVAQFLAERKKKVGATVTIGMADEIEYPWDLRRPVGAVSLDYALGGGWPAGALSQLWGKESAGKTLLGYMSLGSVQRIYGPDTYIVYLSHGIGLDRTLARLTGCQIAFTQAEILGYANNYRATVGMGPPEEDLEAMRTQIGYFEVIEGGDIEAVGGRFAEHKMGEVLKTVESNLCQMIFIDEGAGSIPTRDRLEVSFESEDHVRRGDQSRFLAEWLRCLSASMGYRKDGKPNETSILLAAQRRQEQGSQGPFTKQDKQTGGTALAHHKTIDVNLWHNKTLKQGDLVIGKEIGWRVGKGKLHIREGATGVLSLNFLRDGLIDRVGDAAEAAKAASIIRNRGAYYDIYGRNSEPIVQGIQGGLGGVHIYLRDNPQVLDEVRSAILHTLRVPWRHR